MVRTMVTQVLQLEMDGVEPLVALQGRERLLDGLNCLTDEGLLGSYRTTFLLEASCMSSRPWMRDLPATI